MNAIASILLLVTLAACSTQAWYEASKANAENRCRQQPAGEYDRCMERVNRQRYEDYEKDRKSLNNAKAPT
jgi:hypothetical protein